MQNGVLHSVIISSLYLGYGVDAFDSDSHLMASYSYDSYMIPGDPYLELPDAFLADTYAHAKLAIRYAYLPGGLSSFFHTICQVTSGWHAKVSDYTG